MPRLPEILVYLDDYRSLGDGKYDSIFLDFRSERDYRSYLAATNVRETEGTLLRVDNYSSPKRLFRGAYYALNTDLLKQIEAHEAESSYLIARSYDLSLYRERIDEQNQLLLPHKPFTIEDYPTVQYSDIVFEPYIAQNVPLELRVNNVSQGNWNEIRQGQRTLVVYDIGALVSASQAEVTHYINSFADNYAKDKPYLVISHWDKDHIHCLCGLTDKQLDSFRGVICNGDRKSAMSKRIYKRLQNVLGHHRIACWANPSRIPHTPYAAMHNKTTLGPFSIYIAEKSRSINYSGIVMFVSGQRNNALLTGDCLPCQANDVLHSEVHTRGITTGHFLVVPHHGADFKGNRTYKTYSIPQQMPANEYILSVDEHNNTYGHPVAAMLSWWQSLAPWNEQRTDIQGTIVRML